MAKMYKDVMTTIMMDVMIGVNVYHLRSAIMELAMGQIVHLLAMIKMVTELQMTGMEIMMTILKQDHVEIQETHVIRVGMMETTIKAVKIIINVIKTLEKYVMVKNVQLLLQVKTHLLPVHVEQKEMENVKIVQEGTLQEEILQEEILQEENAANAEIVTIANLAVVNYF